MSREPLTPAVSPAGPTVRDAAFDVLRGLQLTTVFANPGSTEITLLAGLPDDFHFVLALHEASVIGMASGFALGRNQPALALLHTTAGLGNAIGAIATSRSTHIPLVVLVGQQDRRHLAQEPFLTGRLGGLGGDYPVAVIEPDRPQDVPGALVRAHHAAVTHEGPALVIVPQDDWTHPAPQPHEILGPASLLAGAPSPTAEAVDRLVALLDGARSPAIVVGAQAASDVAWEALTTLAQRLGCPVWQEPFTWQPGFPQDHPQFVGYLPADRGRLREMLAAHDVVLVAGGSFLRQYMYAPGPLVADGTRVALVTTDEAIAQRAPVELAVIASVSETATTVAARVAPRPVGTLPPREALASVPRPADGAPLRAAHVYQALAARLPRDVILFEESPSTRHELNVRLPARTPLGFVSAAMGGLGYALPAATGMRMARPDRPVVAIVGDGSSMYSIQALWSAARYQAGALFIVLANGGYRVMDRLAESNDGARVWPSFEDLDLAALARAQGCDGRRIEDFDTLETTLDEVVPTLAGRVLPVLIEVIVEPEPNFYTP